jgi:hypothetical protein
VADNAHTRGEQKNWKTEKTRKKITEKTEPWKKPIKPIKILKKQAGSVRFRFYKSKTEKTEPNPNEKNRAKPAKNRAKMKKPSQTGLNRFLSWKNWTETGRFAPVFVWLFFYIKTELNRKWSLIAHTSGKRKKLATL